MKSNHLKMCKTWDFRNLQMEQSRCCRLCYSERVKKKHFEFQATPDSWCKLVRPGAAHCLEQLQIFLFDRLLQSTLRFVCQLKSLPSACLKRLDMAGAHRHWRTLSDTLLAFPPSTTPTSQMACWKYRRITLPSKSLWVVWQSLGAIFIGWIKSNSLRDDRSQSDLDVVNLVAGRHWSLCVPLIQTVVLHPQ